MTDLPATIAGARRALADGALDPVALVEACLARIEAGDPGLGAWDVVDAAGALDRARARVSAGPSGPLWGIPVGVKDVIDVAGLPATASSRVLAGNVAGTDAPCVEALLAAGAVVLGKTHTHEFAYGAVSPPTRNPWDPTRISGGSSGGSAAAVAAGHCLGALGTDTGGSIRIPAALCGVCGLKPRPGIVPVEGVVPLAPSLDAVGPIAATVEDVALLWEALCGRPRRREPGPFRIGVPDPWALPEIDPEVAAAFHAAVEVLATMGTVAEVGVPPFADFDLSRSRVLMSEALEVHRTRGWWPARAGDYTEETRANLARSERLTPGEIAEARREAARLGGALAAAVEAAGVLATPTVPIPAPTHEEAARVEGTGPRRPAVMALTRIPGAVNVAGLAALTLPCGFTGAGLPVGLHLVARDEDLLLSIGQAYQERTGWHLRRAPF